MKQLLKYSLLEAVVDVLTDDTVEEGSSKVPVILVIEEGDHVREQHIVGLLSAKEHAEARDAILHQRLFHYVLWVTQQGDHLLLHHLVQGLELWGVGGGSGERRTEKKSLRGKGQRPEKEVEVWETCSTERQNLRHEAHWYIRL